MGGVGFEKRAKGDEVCMELSVLFSCLAISFNSLFIECTKENILLWSCYKQPLVAERRRSLHGGCSRRAVD